MTTAALYRYRELYQTGILVEDAAQEIARLSEGEPRPRAVICDHDAEGRATLERHLRARTQPARKEKTLGIQAVAARLKVASDGQRLYVLRDALVRRDPALDESKRPCCLEEEIEGYVRETAGGQRIKDEPIKVNDHALDAMRYAVMHADNPLTPPSPRLWSDPGHLSSQQNIDQGRLDRQRLVALVVAHWSCGFAGRGAR